MVSSAVTHLDEGLSLEMLQILEVETTASTAEKQLMKTTPMNYMSV
jgi:hypothetical protein